MKVVRLVPRRWTRTMQIDRTLYSADLDDEVTVTIDVDALIAAAVVKACESDAGRHRSNGSAIIARRVKRTTRGTSTRRAPTEPANRLPTPKSDSDVRKDLGYER